MRGGPALYARVSRVLMLPLGIEEEGGIIDGRTSLSLGVLGGLRLGRSLLPWFRLHPLGGYVTL